MSRNDRKRGGVEQHLSLAEAAEQMGISERTARRWIKSGKLRASKPGRDYWIPESALAELVEESEVRPKGASRSSREPSFNDVLDERRLSRFASAIVLAAERWGEAVASTDVDDSRRLGMIRAALDLSDLIGRRVEAEDWETLTNEERREIIATMEKLGEVADLGLDRVEESTGTEDQAQRVKERREQIRQWTRQIISA
jgi:excisionase family DNA binding protein